jgi:transcriptional regulator with GAF, ATPase, and Fis domain/CHASE2 domain-containing sensor protein
MIMPRFRFWLLTTSIFVLLGTILESPLTTVEDQITGLKYRLRGDRQADTNIVIVYLDDEAVASLGRPVRRNFHALMVKALSDLRAKAIGIDVVFEGRSEYPEYDDLLARVVQGAGNVVLSTYFQSIEPSPAMEDDPAAGHTYRFPNVHRLHYRGSQLHAPMANLAGNAAGIGHLNLSEDSRAPLFVAGDSGIVPAFPVEVLRVFRGAGKASLVYDGDALSILTEGNAMAVVTAGDGLPLLNYPGRLSTFAAYPFLEVLKSYDALRNDRTPLIPVASFRGKIVLVTVIAPGGNDVSFSSPVDPRYPSIGQHAVFLDNALGAGFAASPSSWMLSLICALVGFACAGAILFLPSPANRVVAVAIPLLVIVLSYVLFATSAYHVPLMAPVVVAVGVTVASLFYDHRRVREQVGNLQLERESITALLRDREAKVALLERELLDFEATRTADRTSELLDEIRKYKAEIHSLTSKADDMEAFTPDVEEIRSAAGEFEGIVYDTGGKMNPVVEFVRKIAGSDAPVLILGESGTGKELVARAVHRRSPRADKPFIAVNCGALSESLLESELFGHEKGAFTGAVKDKLGRFELADGGTIFLDEIGEVSEAFQLKLLRVVQEGELEKVGGTRTLKVNVRVLAATNKDLKAEVHAKRFREDLYYRLNVLAISLPPLRDRQEDIALLINHFLVREGNGMRVSKNVMDALQSYPWRGNIRELESVITRAVLLAKAEQRIMINLRDLSEEVASTVLGGIAIEEQILESVREKGFSRSSVSETAEEMGGLNRGTVAEYLRGQCLKVFVEQGFDVERAVQHISLSADSMVNDRVRKKLGEYLSNITVAVEVTQPWEVTRSLLKPKTKNLPQRFHQYLEQTAEAYFRGLWKAEGSSREIP